MAPTAPSFSPRHVHTDNAVMLLMGKHMLEKGEFPIFYYGQDWFGSLSAMVHAAVFLALGGIPPWSIHVAPLLFFLGFCLVSVPADPRCPRSRRRRWWRWPGTS